eukprot:TRINITY_DN106152_c0_g1_i1.p1 TRINITY_DN106152_c0_g1~~TRINITY_DN106152_c0_g1_i1.p1  ORF type:complete len:147 (-),score=29.61 TRINITY_DN106152_c0_g1_i1:375-815(-)
MSDEKKATIEGSMMGGDDDDSSSSDEEAVVENQTEKPPEPPAKEIQDASESAPQKQPVLDDSDEEEEEPKQHVQAQHALAGISLKKKPARTGNIAGQIRPGSAQTASRPTTAPSYGDEQWGLGTNEDPTGGGTALSNFAPRSKKKH